MDRKLDQGKLEEAYQELELELLEQPDNAILIYYQAIILARKHHEKRKLYEELTGLEFNV